MVKPDLWTQLEILSSGGHESWCSTQPTAAVFQGMAVSTQGTLSFALCSREIGQCALGVSLYNSETAQKLFFVNFGFGD